MANAYLSKMWADGRGNLTVRYADPGETEYDALQAAIFDRLPAPRRSPTIRWSRSRNPVPAAWRTPVRTATSR